MMWHTNAVAVARELERPTFDRCFLVSFGGVASIYPEVLAIMSLLGGVFATWLMIVFPAWISKLLLPYRSWQIVMLIAALLALFLMLAALNVIGDEIPA